MDAVRERAIRWVTSARGLAEDDDTGLASFLARFGYGVADVARMDWLAAAVLLECGDALRDYVERSGGDLRRELEAADADAAAAMNGDPPTEASLRHDLRHRGYRPPAIV